MYTKKLLLYYDITKYHFENNNKRKVFNWNMKT